MISLTPEACDPASAGDPSPTNTVTSSSDSSSLYTSTVQSGPLSANAAFPPHPRLQTSYPPSALFVFSPSAPSPPPLAPGCLYISCFLFHPPPPPPDSLWVLQWKTVGLRARSTELLHFISSHPIDFICIQDSNLNSSPFFRIPKFSALRSDCTHSWSGILSLVMPGTLAAASSFSPGRTYPSRSFLPLSSVDPYSDYVRVYSSFLNVYAPSIRSSPTNSRTDSFFSPPEISSS